MRARAAWGFAVLLVTGTAAAQSTGAPSPLRDPTRPPAAYSAALNPSPAVSAAQVFQPRQVMAVDGERYLIWNSRRYKVGDTIEGAKLERIGDSEIWLRGAEGLRKLSLYAGVEKSTPGGTSATAPAATSGEEAVKSKKGHKK